MSIHRRCRTPDTIAQVRALVVSPNNHEHNHKSPREVVALMRARGIRSSHTTVRRIISEDLHFKNVRRMNVHTLTPQQKQNSVEKCQAWRVDHRANWLRFLFTVMKRCVLQCAVQENVCLQHFNARARTSRHNDRLYIYKRLRKLAINSLRLYKPCSKWEASVNSDV
jgi:hypothetical protein